MFKHQQVAAIRGMRGKMWSPGRPSTSTTGGTSATPGDPTAASAGSPPPSTLPNAPTGTSRITHNGWTTQRGPVSEPRLRRVPRILVDGEWCVCRRHHILLELPLAPGASSGPWETRADRAFRSTPREVDAPCGPGPRRYGPGPESDTRSRSSTRGHHAEGSAAAEIDGLTLDGG